MDIKKTANLFIDFAGKRFAEISGLLLFFLGLALFVALFTYSPEDPNLFFQITLKSKIFLVLRVVLFLTCFFNQLD